MALKIIKATDPVEKKTLITTIIGGPGNRKTTVGFSAYRPLNLDFDDGVARAKFNRGDSVLCKKWGDAASMTAADLAEYQTIVVDTVGRAVEALGMDIMDKDPKMGYGGSPSLPGWGRIKAQFIGWLALLRSFGKDIVLLAHLDEQQKGDDTLERIICGGSSKNEIHMVSDMMGRLTRREGKLMLVFAPSDTAFGKDPGQLGPIVVPTLHAGDHFLGELIERTKASLNAMNEEQTAVSAALAEWNELVQKAATPDALNKLLTALDHVDARAIAAAKAILWKHAKEHGMTYDKEGAKFTEKEVTGAPC